MLFALIGLLIGAIMGLLGGGGTVVLLPLLVYVAEMGTHQAIATSLVVVGCAAASGALQHGLAGRVRLRMGLAFGLASLPLRPSVFSNLLVRQDFFFSRLIQLFFSFFGGPGLLRRY